MHSKDSYLGVGTLNMFLTWEVDMHSKDSYFGVGTLNMFLTWEMNTIQHYYTTSQLADNTACDAIYTQKLTCTLS